jgi:hypothetical protein
MNIYDGTISPGGLGGRYPRIGHIRPKACYKDGVILNGPPDRWLVEQEVATYIVAPNRGVMPDDVYVEEIGDPAWGLGNPATDQRAQDLRAGFLEVTRAVIGKRARLCMYDYPLGNVMQAINWRDPALFQDWAYPMTVQAGRSRLDVRPALGTVPSAAIAMLDVIALSLYWNTDTSKMLPPGTTEAEAFWSCAEPQLVLAHSFGKPVYSFVRIMAPAGEPPNGIPVPQEVINLYYRLQQPRGAGAAMVIWEAYGLNGKGPPADAPGMKAYAGKA